MPPMAAGGKANLAEKLASSDATPAPEVEI
jgi:hypothetical protein